MQNKKIKISTSITPNVKKKYLTSQYVNHLSTVLSSEVQNDREFGNEKFLEV